MSPAGRPKDNKHKTVAPESNLYDVKFYPYTKAGDDPIFAATGSRMVWVAAFTSKCGKILTYVCYQTIVARPKLENKNLFEILQSWQEEAEVNCEGKALRPWAELCSGL